MLLLAPRCTSSALDDGLLDHRMFSVVSDDSPSYIRWRPATQTTPVPLALVRGPVGVPIPLLASARPPSLSVFISAISTVRILSTMTTKGKAVADAANKVSSKQRAATIIDPQAPDLVTARLETSTMRPQPGRQTVLNRKGEYSSSSSP